MDLAALVPDAVGLPGAALLVVASFFTSALTAALGLGGGVAMLALLGIFVPVAALIPIHSAVQLGSNSGRAWHQRPNIRYDVLGPYTAGTVVGVAAGALLVVQLPDSALKIGLGLFIVAITWVTIPGMDGLGRAGLAVGSAALAFLGMFVGAIGPMLMVFFAQIVTEGRKPLVATHAAGMTIQHLLKLAAFGVAGFAFRAWLPLVGAMVASGYVGTVYGTRLLDRMSEGRFRLWYRIAITVLALDMVRRGVAALF